MVLHKRLSGYAALAILAGLLGTYTTSADAASVVMQKRPVPAVILKGSALVKGRAFYRTSMSENSLAGIKLGRKASEVLLKWGNPTRITLSSGQTAQPAAAAGGPGVGMMPGMGMGAGMPGVGGGAMMPGMGMGGGAAAPPGMPGPMAGGGMMPGMGMGAGAAAPPGMPGPMAGGGMMPGMGMGGGAMMPGMGAGAAPTSSVSSNEVVWTYDLSNGITIEFVISENVVTQITIGGVGPWGLSKTRMGLQLGDSYKLVIWVAGYPESQEFVGRFLRLSYVNRSRVLFTLDKNKVVGVTIALDPNNVR